MIKKLTLFILIAAVVFSCIEDFELDYSSQKEIVFINADLNDLDSVQYITVRKNIPTANSILIADINNANVKVVEDGSKEYLATFVKEGRYKMPDKFKIIPGKEYYLEFKLENGKTYRSKKEKISKAPVIDSLYLQFVPDGITYENKEMAGHKVFLNTTDKPSESNYYKWTWRMFERQYYCKTCEGGRYFTSPLPLGRCVEDINLRRRGAIYDYSCNRECWQIIYNSDINIMSDDFLDGGKITARNVAKAPFLQFNGALVEISQYNIPKSAYEYFKLVISLGQSTGTLADTPPAGLLGNIKNVSDASEPVGGIFMVSSKANKTVWISREGIKNLAPYGLFKGREVSPEPSGNDTTRPPLAPCIESEDRTSIKPPNWIF